MATYQITNLTFLRKTNERLALHFLHYFVVDSIKVFMKIIFLQFKIWDNLYSRQSLSTDVLYCNVEWQFTFI
jgi:hypothetical protein